LICLATTHGSAAQPGAPSPASEVATESTRTPEARADAAAAAVEAETDTAAAPPLTLPIDTANPYRTTAPLPPPIARIDTRNPYLAEAAPAVRSAPGLIMPAPRATGLDPVNPYVTRDVPPAPRVRDVAPHGRPSSPLTPAIDTHDPYSQRERGRRQGLVALAVVR
jgi:hypothetical protein